MASPAPLPFPPEPSRLPEPDAPVVVPAPPAPRGPSKPGALLTVGMCAVAAALTAAVMLTMTSRAPDPAAGQGFVEARTAMATSGELRKSLRIGGTLATLDFAAIRAPRLRGPRDAARAELVLAKLAEAGTVVPAGTVVAEFELRWLVDHIKDRQSIQSVVEANKRKREAQVQILKETERQARVAAKAEYDKAMLDLGTAEVRSEIEAEVLKNLADEKRATFEQLKVEGGLMETVHAADLRGEELEVTEEVLHVERHLRDLERLQVKTPINGMVVRESMFNKSGVFAQTKEGDRVYPGALFMRIVDTSQMVVSASVNQVDAQSIQIGDEAVVELDAYPGERFEGHVTEIGAVAASGGAAKYGRSGNGAYVKHIPVRVLIDAQDERILPDLSAGVDILLSGSDEGVLVPREAIRADADAKGDEFVYVASDGRFRRRPVRVQDVSDTMALVATGLAAGEEVLLSEFSEPLHQ